jgi:hypothetical protein
VPPAPAGLDEYIQSEVDRIRGEIVEAEHVERDLGQSEPRVKAAEGFLLDAEAGGRDTLRTRYRVASRAAGCPGRTAGVRGSDRSGS